MVIVNSGDQQFYLDVNLKKNLDEIKNSVLNGGWDYLCIVAGIVGVGKCQPADSKVMMANGEWKNVQDIKIGDKVLSPQKDGTNKFATVLETTNWFCNDVYNIISINKKNKKLYSCSGNHIIPINYKSSRSNTWEIRHITPKDILNNTYFDKNNTAITCLPIKEFYGRQNCIIEPYTLGALLGDGCLSAKYGKDGKKTNNRTHNLDITCADEEIIKEIEKTYVIMSVANKKSKAKSYRFSRYNYYTKIKALSLFDELKEVGLIEKRSGDKFIPQDALYSDINYRKRLLAGLIDTDRYHPSRTGYEITTKSPQLAEDIEFLVNSLGGRCSGIKKTTKGIKKINFKVSFNFPYEIDLPIQVERKKRKFLLDGKIDSNRTGVYVLRSEKTKSCQVYGFELDSESHWYITDNYLVTHNSTFAQLVAKYLDPTFSTEERICFKGTGEKGLIERTSVGKVGQAFVLDESFESLNTKITNSYEFIRIINHLQLIRQKGLFIILCLPNFFDLSKGIAIFRANHLFVIYSDRYTRGFFAAFDRERKKKLYVLGNKFMNYNCVEPNFRGKFVKKWVVNLELYNKLKDEHLISQGTEKEKRMTKKQFKIQCQRDILIKKCYEDKIFTVTELVDLIKLPPTNIRVILHKEINKEELNSSNFTPTG